MTSIEFEEEKQLIINTPNTSSFLNSFLIKKGLAEGEKQANIILIIIVTTLFLGTIAVIYFFIFDKKLNTNPVNYENAKIIKEYRDQGLRGS